MHLMIRNEILQMCWRMENVVLSFQNNQELNPVIFSSFWQCLYEKSYNEYIY